MTLTSPSASPTTDRLPKRGDLPLAPLQPELRGQPAVAVEDRQPHVRGAARPTLAGEGAVREHVLAQRRDDDLEPRYLARESLLQGGQFIGTAQVRHDGRHALLMPRSDVRLLHELARVQARLQGA